MEDLVLVMNNEVVCNSLMVAEKFEKRHNNILRDISNLLKNEQVKSRKIFRLSSYKDTKGEERPMYTMNRKGFTILVMGFNGDKALHWKLLYSDAFDEMEEMLKERNTQLWIEQRTQGKLIRNAETDVIKKLIQYAQKQGSTHADMLYMTYSKLANKMAGISDRDLATFQQLSELSFIENIILNQICVGMEKKLHYKEIYKDCKRQIELFKDIAYLEIKT